MSMSGGKEGNYINPLEFDFHLKQNLAKIPN